jgi:hypothetical protein
LIVTSYELMAFRVARDTDLAKTVAELAHRGEEPGRVRKLAGLLPRVTGDHEHLAYVRGLGAKQHLGEVLSVADEPSRNVRDRLEPA